MTGLSVTPPKGNWRAIDPSELSACEGPSVQAPSYCYDAEDLFKISIKSQTSKEITSTYTLPRKLLMWHSSYFAAALDPANSASFADMTTNELTLEEDAKVFETFCCWLYTGRLKDIPNAIADTALPDQYLPSITLCKIWVFSDMRGVPAMGNAAINMLHERVAASWRIQSGDCIKYSYRNTSEGSHLRKFFVDLHTKLASYDEFQHCAQRLTVVPEFLLDTMPILVCQGEFYEGMPRDKWTALDRCEWHDHSGPGGQMRLDSRK